MNVTKIYPPAAMPVSLENAAEALAHLKQMTDDLAAANQLINELRNDLNRERDRVELLLDDVERERNNGLVYRDLVIELATQMNAIGDMTLTANRIVEKVKELTAPKPARVQQTSE